MSGWVIRRLEDGAYLKSFDPDWMPPGVTPETAPMTGLADWTTDTAEALTFPDAGEAGGFWRQQSTVKPLRPDGAPNRPLTAYTVAVEPLP